MSVGNFRILSVVCSASTAYTSLCRDLKYSLKVQYTDLRAFMSEVVCLLQTLTYCVYIFWYVNILNMTAGYGRFSNYIAFLEIFHILLHV